MMVTLPQEMVALVTALMKYWDSTVISQLDKMVHNVLSVTQHVKHVLVQLIQIANYVMMKHMRSFQIVPAIR